MGPGEHSVKCEYYCYLKHRSETIAKPEYYTEYYKVKKKHVLLSAFISPLASLLFLASFVIFQFSSTFFSFPLHAGYFVIAEGQELHRKDKLYHSSGDPFICFLHTFLFKHISFHTYFFNETMLPKLSEKNNLRVMNVIHITLIKILSYSS